MKIIAVIGLIAGSGLLCACTYDGLRMQERSKCIAMPQSQAEHCFARTRMTRQEYDAERAKLRRAEGGGRPQREDKVDPRYEKWIP